jgi:putative membrane protein
MQRALFLSAAAIAALSLSACNKSAEQGDTGASASAANPGQTAPVNAAQDATAAAVGTVSASTMGSHDTGSFVSNATMGNMYEVEAGKMASTRAKSADLKSFGKMMVTDHTAMLNEM